MLSDADALEYSFETNLYWTTFVKDNTILFLIRCEMDYDDDYDYGYSGYGYSTSGGGFGDKVKSFFTVSPFSFMSNVWWKRMWIGVTIILLIATVLTIVGVTTKESFSARDWKDKLRNLFKL